MHPERFKNTVMPTFASKAAGGCVAHATSFVMKVGAINPAAAAATVFGVALPAAAIGLICKAHDNSQKHTMGDATGVGPGHRWVVAVHNWGTVELRSFVTEEEARTCFQGGLELRRILVYLNDSSEPDIDNGHGWRLPWREIDHAGWGHHLDNEVRGALLSVVV